MARHTTQVEIDDFFVKEMVRVNAVVDRARSATKTFCLRVGGQEVWKAMWRGQVSLGEWTQKGPAQAWIDTCEMAGRFRA